ncbi:hypothetical protein [Tepidimonas sp.]|uniref:hypothetical protein n=1 Tax=Tepidimonas sp. TaxID=2002775 RepID=UPI002FE27F3C
MAALCLFDTSTVIELQRGEPSVSPRRACAVRLRMALPQLLGAGLAEYIDGLKLESRPA